MKRIGLTILLVATSLLVWGTGFEGRSFGPIRFLLQVTPYGDKVGHFVLYGSIVFALALLAKRTVPAVIAAAMMFIIGVADEFRQLFVGGRNFDLKDIAANTLGICLGLIAAMIIVAALEDSRAENPGRVPAELAR